MSLSYRNLDAKTRSFMKTELDWDISNGRLYISPRLNPAGKQAWASLLEEAFSQNDDSWLAQQLLSHGFMNSHEERRTKTGVTMARVPVTAPETLAEGEFNRFYVRGLCLRAIEDGTSQVIVYRARHSASPRLESEAIIGKHFDPNNLLQDLRNSPGVEPALGVPPGPNSGLSIYLP